MNKLIIMLLSSILLLFSKAGLTEEPVKDVDGFSFPLRGELSEGYLRNETILEKVGYPVDGSNTYYNTLDQKGVAKNIKVDNTYDRCLDGLPGCLDNTGLDGKWRNVSDVGNYSPSFNGLHSGEDWNFGNGNNDAGKEVYSIAHGKVVAIGKTFTNSTSAGWYMVIKHKLPTGSKLKPYVTATDYTIADAVYSVYMHITDQSKTDGSIVGNYTDFKTIKIGSIVTPDTLIARIANMTKMSPHLHFEIRSIDLESSCQNKKNDGTPIESKNAGCLYPKNNNSYYKPTTPSDASSVIEAMNNMKAAGILDPSDFINANKDIKACAPSNPSTATVTSVTVSRDEDGTNFDKVNGVFQLKSLHDNTNYKVSLSGDNFIDDGGCPSNITVEWKFANRKPEPFKKSISSSNDKIEFIFNEGPGRDRLGEWEFTVYKNNTSIANIKATTNMDAISPAVSSCFSDMQGLNDDKKKALCSLKSQRIISGYEASREVKPHDLINRAEFSKIISVDHEGNELNESWDCTDADNKFYDVPKEDWSCKYIKYAFSKEIVSGYSAANTPCKKEDDQNYDSKNYFCPGGYITYQESLKMIFKSIFNVDNGWVDGSSVLSSNDAPFNSYVGCARDLKLFGEGFVFNFNSTIKRGDVFLALYNARQLIELTENSNKKLTLKSNSACIFE